MNLIKGTSGVYYFPCNGHLHSDHVFGAVSIDAQRKPFSEITSAFLKEGWTSDVEVTPFNDVTGVLWTHTTPDKTKRNDEWSAEQIWGYAQHHIPGKGKEKRYTRKIHFVSPSLTKDVLLIYDRKDDGTTTMSSNVDEEDLSSFGTS